MTSPGMLRIGLTPAGAVSVNLTRPLVARVFIGQNPEAVVKTVPYLYTLCAHAQRAAAQAALAAAGGVPARTLDADELWLEVVHENFWRLLLDWPVVFGLAPAKAEFVRWRGERFGPQRNAATRDVLVRVLQPLIENCLAATVDRPTATEFDFPGLTPADWLAYCRGAHAAVPASRRPASVAEALLRRLAEVTRAVQALENGLPFPMAAAGEAGWGVGQSLTARGVLTHAARVEDGVVTDYRVWAPTDCHFADAGGLQALLAGSVWPEQMALRQRIDQAVLALDPCLPYVVEWDDA